MRIVNQRQTIIQIGEKFGRLTVVGVPFAVQIDGKRRTLFVCECSCGGIIACEKARLGRKTRSCGCLRNDIAAARSRASAFRIKRIASIWGGMWERCTNPDHMTFSNYGARGIRVCDEWASLDSFQEWALSSGYEPHLTIDRRDSNGNYEPNNCRWITAKEQGFNRRDNHWVEAFGERKTVIEWSLDPRCVVKRTTINQRLKKGWPPEVSISHPANLKRRLL